MYNHLNLPLAITIAGKGTITYQYDAMGNKLSKTVLDNTGSSSKTTVTDYDGVFVYKQDSLELISHEEGRIRPIYKPGAPVTYAYDYFEKDHLGNVRTVLTDQTDFTMYAATMETEAAPQEVALFSNVEETRAEKPSGYPEDQTTEENKFVAKLNAKTGARKIGPSLVLRVMAGDTVQIKAKAFYKSQGPDDNNGKAPVEDIVAGLVQAFGGTTGENGSHGPQAISNNTPFNADFYNNNYQRLKEKNKDNGQSNRPKAYLNFVLFDDNFKLVDDNSGVRQVKASPDELQELGVEKMAMEKNGFLYVYTSNESQQDVFFDNVVLGVNSGPLLEETHYYPYGLTMTGISTNAYKGANYAKNRKEYNGVEHTTDLDLNKYDAFYRTLDPQIGRWLQLDPKCEFFDDVSPYNHVLNNPITMSDPFGDDTVHVNDLPNVWPDFNPDQDIVNLPGIVVTPNGSHASRSNPGALPGYKVLPALHGFWNRAFNQNRQHNNGWYRWMVDYDGILTNRLPPTAGVPSGLVNAASPGGGLNLIKVGNSIRTIIAELKWSSKGVALAAKLLKSGVREVTVKSRAEAEELLLGIYGGKGLRNTTGMSATEAKRFFGEKANTYHWDDAVDETGRLLNHAANNAHSAMKHLQIHNEEGQIFRIFFE